ncbi:hypothetical protein ACIBCA_03975 [Kitasatospora sp. NPDC051170]|uniref:hypothetical protein n=1 Tax=Kitasatospora sp. NPDC051170 TaxID=3364056 RepID=UPI0037B620F7
MTQAAITLLLLGSPALVLGVLWTADFRGITTRATARQTADRARLPARLRPAWPRPAPLRAQRLFGALLAVTGGLFVGAGCWALLP